MKLSRVLPEFESLIMTELAISLLIIAIVIAIIIPNYEIDIKKAEISKVFNAFGSDKVEMMINMALTGEGFLADSSASKFSRKEVAIIDGGEVHEKLVGNTLSFEAKTGEPFYITFSPSVVAEGPIGSVLWLCGNQKAPAGWTQPSHTGTDLQPALIPSDCRDL
jgi:Tfp pilus assembly major pilin PilA